MRLVRVEDNQIHLRQDMKDLEPILDVLCNYQAGFVLSPDELGILSEWLKESPEHERFFKELNNNLKWVMGYTDRNPREKIQNRLIEMEETGA